MNDLEEFCMTPVEEIDQLQARIRVLEESERFWETEAGRLKSILVRLRRRVVGADASIRSATELLENEEL